MKICSRLGKFELMNVNHSAGSEGIIGISFPFSHKGVSSLESPQRGDSNEYTLHTTFNNKKESHPKLSQIYCYVIFIGSQERGRDSRGKRAIIIRAIDVLLYMILLLKLLLNMEHGGTNFPTCAVSYHTRQSDCRRAIDNNISSVDSH